MARPDFSSSNASGDALVGFIDALAKLLLYAGLITLVLGVGLLINTAAQGVIGDPQKLEQALVNIRIFGQMAFFGGIAAAVGSAWLLWGEETVGPLQIIVGSALYFSPTYVPSMFNIQVSDSASSALEATALAGAPIAVIGILLVLSDLLIRMRTRVREGARADQLKFGKGMKEERDIRNVFLGKCWQLPYCRKFVRERCPIYHARRTCWKERVGCMCEESVIQNAMEGKVIPTDIVAASKYIPRNSKLTPGQKAERCRQCVIYNEHQKHKYQLALPMSALGLVGLYVAMRIPMKNALQVLLESMDRMTRSATLSAPNEASDVTSLSHGVIPYSEIILVAMFLIVFAYIVRAIEYFFFRLKI